ncbi:MAG: hypothetical protein ABJN40_21220 [Sneathiella sp.]
MVVRKWIGYAKKTQAEAYRTHISETVFPEVRLMPGFRQALLLAREVKETASDEVEFQALTFWQDMASVHAFSGDDLYTAVIEPRAQEVLSRFQTKVEYYEALECVFPIET